MTSAISSFIAPPAPQASAMPAMPAPDTGFARMLSQRQAMAQDAAKPAVADKAAAPATDEPTHAPASPQPAARRAAQSAERPPAKAEKPATPDPAKAGAAKATEGEETAAAGEAGADIESIDPALAEWLAALNFPTPAAEAPASGRARGAASAGDEVSAGGEVSLTGPLAKGAAGGKAGVELGAKLRDDAAQDTAHTAQAAQSAHGGRDKPDALAAEPATSAAAWQAAAERVNAPAELQARQEAPALGALGVAQAPTVARANEAAPPVSVTLPTPATTPEFAQSLGVQVSVLARGGVQQAELHLNPAEMGPISVQIALDGNQAQVNFGADSAATRQIIESGLPELAAALRDAGFTLSGGGVQGQARGRGEGGAGEQGAGRQGSPSEAEVTPQRINARVAAGGVDLYA